jgi:hypothetical protein
MHRGLPLWIGLLTSGLIALAMVLGGCAMDRPMASPPPGSHSPFTGSLQGDPSAGMRDRPEPPPVEPDEEELDEVEEER